MTSKQTNQHRHTFSLREDLSTALSEFIAVDDRVSPINHVDNFYRDLSEWLIESGWVADYPEEDQ